MGATARQGSGGYPVRPMADGGGVRPGLRWAAVAVWCLVILGFGSDDFSAEATSRFLDPLLRWLLPGASDETIALGEWAIRKAAHAVEYGVLASLAWYAARPRLAPWPAAGLALAIALGLAGVDEARQAGLGTRSGSAKDVAIDGAGAVLALGLLLKLGGSRRGSSRARV